MKFYEKIKKHEHKFTDTEDMIVEYILNNKEDVVNISIQALADKFFTVPNTIIRLCKKMEYDGFSQLKNKLKDELKNENIEIKSDFEMDIKKTLDLIDYEQINKVGDIIHKARNIVVYGIGQNSPLCEVFVKELKTSRKNVQYYNYRHEVIHDIKNLGEQDLVFAISISGKTAEVLEAVEIAKNNKCKIITLTNLCENPLEKMANINLYCHSTVKKINGYNIPNKVPIMMILRIIIEQYWLIIKTCV